MKDVLGSTLLLLCAVQIQGLSKLTDDSGQNVTQLHTNNRDERNVDVFRQLLNQETIIRIGLVKNVHTLMKDMITMKQKIETLESASQKTNSDMADLQQEVKKLKQENQRLDLQNRKCEENLNNVRTNFSQVNEYLKMSEEKRRCFETNTSTILGDLKVEVRYLSITVLDLNEHKLELDKKIPKMIGDKYVQLSTRLDDFMETRNSSQNATITSLFGKSNVLFQLKHAWCICLW
jgi:septal ring factor EnvC (AmiA/AmiB activator)